MSHSDSVVVIRRTFPSLCGVRARYEQIYMCVQGTSYDAVASYKYHAWYTGRQRGKLSFSANHGDEHVSAKLPFGVKRRKNLEAGNPCTPRICS